MKSAAAKKRRKTADFYISTLAPVGRQREARFGLLDVSMLSVLFLELAVFARLLLAH